MAPSLFITCVYCRSAASCPVEAGYLWFLHKSGAAASFADSI